MCSDISYICAFAKHTKLNPDPDIYAAVQRGVGICLKRTVTMPRKKKYTQFPSCPRPYDNIHKASKCITKQLYLSKAFPLEQYRERMWTNGQIQQNRAVLAVYMQKGTPGATELVVWQPFQGNCGRRVGAMTCSIFQVRKNDALMPKSPKVQNGSPKVQNVQSPML